MDLGADGPVSGEDLAAAFRLEHIHAGLIVSLHRADGNSIAGVDIGVHPAALGQEGRHRVLMEAVQVLGAAVVHHLQQGVLIDDIALQRGEALAVIGAVKIDLSDKTVLTHHVAVVALGRGMVGTDGGDLRAGVLVLLHDLGQVNVGAEIAQQQHQVLLGNIPHVGAHGVERLDGTGVVAPVILWQAEGGQHP